MTSGETSSRAIARLGSAPSYISAGSTPTSTGNLARRRCIFNQRSVPPGNDGWHAVPLLAFRHEPSVPLRQ
ncbi:hypothetical protein CHU32_10725 [Superficieibacter electus]|uniref:Uncharacterized protein n=1 Tax=Superficieibacter electus TaxID=2022662 RepID=A0A2P5GR71_9ENTR|nr:hypothetical protein CHU33_18085 [Superficieibacter electus]POP49047.1 hypothetical protein CHU32_10725 [Superficieibacter electus]